MFKVIDVPTFTDERGSLSVVEKCIPFSIKRLYYIYNVNGKRGGHRHKESWQALICLSGSVDIYMNNGKSSSTVSLDDPKQCLIIKPEDWHVMENFSSGAVVLVMASTLYDPTDYIEEPYE